MTDEKPDNLMAALAMALPKLEGAKKDASNSHFKAKYATLGAVIEAIKPIAEHGIWYLQVELERDNGAAYETFYIGFGEKQSAGVTFVPADRNNAQGFGSARTYARRYGLMSAFGLSTEDDDGNAAAIAPPKREAKAITEDQYSELMLLFTHMNVPVADFLKAAKIGNLKALHAAEFERAKNWINAKAKAVREAEEKRSVAEDLDDEIPNFEGAK